MTDLKRMVRRVARGIGPRGFKPDIVMTIYPGGVLGLRESGRRKEYQLGVGELLVLAVKRDVELTRRTRRAKKRKYL